MNGRRGGVRGREKERKRGGRVTRRIAYNVGGMVCWEPNLSSLMVIVKLKDNQHNIIVLFSLSSLFFFFTLFPFLLYSSPSLFMPSLTYRGGRKVRHDVVHVDYSVDCIDDLQ